MSRRIVVATKYVRPFVPTHPSILFQWYLNIVVPVVLFFHHLNIDGFVFVQNIAEILLTGR